MLRKLMGRRFNDRLSRLASAGLLAASLIGCAALEPAKPEDAVKRLATARLQSLMAGDFDKAYKMLMPSYRSVVSFDRFRGDTTGAAFWKGAEVIKVSCEPEKCTARVRIDFQHPLAAKVGGVLSTHIDEIWLLEGDQWWIFQKL